MNCSTPGFPVLHLSWRTLKFMFIGSVMLSNHLILCRPLLLLPSIFPSIRVFSNELALPIRWPRYWSFCFSICPSNEYSRLISFRIDCFNLLAVQETLKSLHQHHTSKPSILQCSVFFMVQLSHPNESHFLGRLIRSLEVPKERGVWNSQGGRKDTLFFLLYIP